MSILMQHIPFVKGQIEFQTRMVKANEGNLNRVNFHRDLEDKFLALFQDMELADSELDKPHDQLVSSPPAPQKLRLALAPDEIDGLPDELLKELSISDGDKTEYLILSLIEERGGFASLDQLLVGIYHKTNEVLKRQTLTSKIYRMSQKDMIFSVPGKKGVYSARPLTDEESARLFGGTDL